MCARGVGLLKLETDRAVVAAFDLIQYPRIGELLHQYLGGAKVVQPPANVSLAGSCSIRPPTVAFGRVRVQVTETINEVRFKDGVETGAFFVGKASVFAVWLWVGQVDLLVGDVKIATENHGLGRFECFDVGEEVDIPLFGAVVETAWALILVVALSIWRINGDEEIVVKFSANDTTLVVVFFDPQSILNGARRGFAQNGRAGVAFLCRAVPIGVRVAEKGEVVDEIAGNLGFLQAEDVWLFALKKGFEPFLEGSSESVDVP